MLQFNQVFIKGYVGQEPKVDYLPSGVTVAQFSVAATERWTKDGEKKEKTNWIPIKAWGKIAEIAVDNGLGKGTPVLIVGSLDEERWEKEGKRHSKIVVKAMHIDILRSGREEPGE